MQFGIGCGKRGVPGSVRNPSSRIQKKSALLFIETDVQKINIEYQFIVIC